jgi:uncharacterized protein YhaN
MRFRRLRLERFGLFTDRELLFDPAVRLQLVYGPNEAGKSTALQAIGDLLFGIGVRSTYGFLHGYAGMRIAAEIEARDGSRAWFARRKGQRDTLRDADDAPQPEAALRRFLGPVDRALFESMFGLDCDRLRAGGEEMLQAKGEIGESLFQASAGLGGLIATVEELEAEAAAIFGDRRGKRAFNEAREAYDKAQSALRQRRIRPEEFRDLKRRREETVTALQAAAERQRTLTLARARAERIRRVHPDVAALAAAEAGLAGLGRVRALPEDAAARRQEAIAAAERAAADLARLAELRAEAEARLAGLADGSALRGRAAEIRALAARHGAALKAEADLPVQRTRARDAGQAAAEGLERLGLPLSPAEAARLLPDDLAKRRVRTLAAEMAALTQAAEAAARRHQQAEAEGDRLRQALAAAPTLPDPAPLAAAVAEAGRLGDVDAALAEGAAADARAAAGLAVALASLPLWSGEARALAAAAVPEGAAVARHQAAWWSLAEQRRRLEEEIGRRQAEQREAAAALAALATGAPVATASAIAAARQRRDAAWTLLRRRHLEGGAAPGAAELAALDLEILGAAELERLVAAADALSDRRISEADRVAAYEAAQQKQARQSEGLAVAAERRRRLEAQQATLEAEWHALWQPAGIVPRPPEDMAEWLGRRREVLAALAASDDAAAAHAAAGRRAALARAALAAALAAFGGSLPEGPFTRLLAAAETAAATQAEARRRRQLLEERLAAQESTLSDIAAEERRAGQALAGWRAAWAAAMERLLLPASTLPEEAEAALSLWDGVAARLAEERAACQRVQDMERDVAALAEAAARCAAAVAPELAADGLAAPPLLLQRLERALAAEEERGRLAAQLERLGQQEAAAAERGRAAAASLQALSALAGTNDDAGLAAAIERADRKRALARQVADLLQRIRAGGDGHSPEALAAECREADLDALAAAVADIDDELGRLQLQASALGAQLQQVEADLAALGAGRDAAAAAEEAEAAVAEMREGAQRWVPLRAAALLLRRGLERYRQEQEGPLLRRAGEHFRLLTGGRYGELAVAVDERERALLVARTADGGERAVEAMSEGTRDQLYLALRLAAVEHHAEQAEPLPFIGDDLLVNFDDERAAAGLRLLAHLGETTQAILFTHHRHLVELAERTLPPDQLAIHDLGMRAAA